MNVVPLSWRRGDNDHALITAMIHDGTRVMEAAGAGRVLVSQGTHHVLGTCGMGTAPATSVVGRNMSRPRCEQPMDM